MNILALHNEYISFIAAEKVQYQSLDAVNKEGMWFTLYNRIIELVKREIYILSTWAIDEICHFNS